MSLKSRWENCHIEKHDPYIWIFVNGKMLIVNDRAYKRAIRENYKNKEKFYKGTEIKKEGKKQK
jgi:hypothetical protein